MRPCLRDQRLEQNTSQARPSLRQQLWKALLEALDL
jgi:hypothetical protein